MSHIVNQEKRYVNYIKAAQAFDLSPATIRKLTHKKAIPFLRVGRAVRYDLNELEAHFRAQRNE
jgi:excisionase family DNA binding protein